MVDEDYLFKNMFLSYTYFKGVKGTITRDIEAEMI